MVWLLWAHVAGIIVHLSGRVVEAHFHFFVMIGVITLYQDWLPFGLVVPNRRVWEEELPRELERPGG